MHTQIVVAISRCWMSMPQVFLWFCIHLFVFAQWMNGAATNVTYVERRTYFHWLGSVLFVRVIRYVRLPFCVSILMHRRMQAASSSRQPVQATQSMCMCNCWMSFNRTAAIRIYVQIMKNVLGCHVGHKIESNGHDQARAHLQTATGKHVKWHLHTMNASSERHICNACVSRRSNAIHNARVLWERMHEMR